MWFQQLELVLGSTAVSLAVILATFMGGTCLGSILFPRVASERKRPLRTYAAIELAIGIFGIATVVLIPLAGAPDTGFFLRGTLAALCLLPPTLFMGATLPALSRSTEDAASLGFLYAANIAGAVFGCLLTGFWLLRWFDAPTATRIAALVNLGTAALAFAMPSRHKDPVASAEDSERPDSTVLLAIALSGLTALAAEAIWTRTLGLLLGASVYTLSIILAVFLTGLGIGSTLASLLSRALIRPRLALAWCQLLLIPAIAWTSYNLSASMPYWPTNPSISSDISFNFQLDLARAFWALLPPTLLWGASFPFALSAAGARLDPARLMARIYAANTIGAIVGALAATLLLISWIGSQHAEQLLIAFSALAAILLMLPRPASCALLALLATAACIYTVHTGFEATHRAWPVCSYVGGQRRRRLRSRGHEFFGRRDAVPERCTDISRGRKNSGFERPSRHAAAAHARPPFYADAHAPALGPRHRVRRRKNHREEAVSIDPQVERVTIDEIEPLVPRTAATWFGRENFNVIHNPKVHLKIDDGRHFLVTTQEKFDAITVDPLDPWVKGAANLYTKEFLKPRASTSTLAVS